MRTAPALPALLLVLAAALVAPSAGAQGARTLSDLEEPVTGENLVMEVRVTPEEAGKDGIVVYLNAPGRPFGLVVYRADGTTAFDKNGTRGVQPFPALTAGAYKFFIRGQGAFQLTTTYLDRLGGNPVVTEVNGTLRGADAYVFAPTRGWILRIEGAPGVQAELRDLGGATRTLPLPFEGNFTRGSAYVLTFRGAPGASYRVSMERVGPDPVETDGNETRPTPGEGGSARTPGPAPAFVAAGVALAALAWRRRA